MAFDVLMDPTKPHKVTSTCLRVIDISTPDQHSSYVTQDLLTEPNSCFTSDLNRVYRISWKPEGGYASKGLVSERVHEIIILSDENRCEVRT